MNKFVYFMAVGLAFIALQVATVEASHDQAHVDEMRATEDSALDTARAAEDSARQTMRETEDNARQTMRETEDNARQTRRDTEDRDRQAAADAMNAAAGAAGGTGRAETCDPNLATDVEGSCGYTGGGDHHPMMDPRTDPPQPFSPADEAIYQPYADECESNGGTISEASMAILIIPPHNFTRLQVEGLCQASAHTDGDGGDASCMPLADGSLPPHCN